MAYLTDYHPLFFKQLKEAQGRFWVSTPFLVKEGDWCYKLATTKDKFVRVVHHFMIFPSRHNKQFAPPFVSFIVTPYPMVDDIPTD